jgi:hypothetical protein
MVKKPTQQVDARGPKPQVDFCNTRLWVDYIFIQDKLLFYQRFWPVILSLAQNVMHDKKTNEADKSHRMLDALKRHT